MKTLMERKERVMIFSKNDTADKIGKKITDVQKQLAGFEAQVATKEAEIEKAITDGNDPPDKLLVEIGHIRLKESAAKKVLAGMEAELGIAAERERRAAAFAEIDQLKKKTSAALNKLSDRGKRLVETAKSFYRDVNTFNDLADDIRIPGLSLPANVYGVRNLNANLILRVFAMASDTGHNLSANIEAAGDDLDHQLDLTTGYINGAIEKLKRAVDFFSAGKKVKFTLQFKGREITMISTLGPKFFERITTDLHKHEVGPLVEEKEQRGRSYWSKTYFIKTK